ncbi:hypothetical protein [Janthinobacterium sp. RB2R34]|uniref:hypothetical protein n=1 Tax=Janthinobacterium sp. RB2R34 TaxID=3424193 RepID=UPI003F1F0C07
MKNETDKVAPILPSVLPIVAKSTTGDEALMAFCDRRFGKLMHSSLVNPPVDAAPASTFSEEEQALARYRQVRDRAGCVPSPRIQQGKCEKTRLALGVGPRVFIGFDAEWQFLRKGRNRILSVQFCLIGPSGEIMYKVIHLDNHDTERPSLSQAIYELLDEAVDDGIIDDWPIEVVLCGFFTRADITVFSDFKKFRHELSGVGGTLVTVGGAVAIELPMSEKRQQQLKSHYQYVVDSMIDPKLLSIRLVDSSRLAPPGKSLAYLGNVLGLPKIDLPAGFDKSDMASFQREEKKKFEAYGLRDAEIAVTYVLWVVWFSTRYLGLNMDRLPATASGLAVRVAEACIRSDGVELNVALNFEEKQVTRWDNKTHRARVQKKRVPKRIRGWLEAFLADAYVGGRNECYMFGPTVIKRFFDPDLSGAYLTALAYLLVLDYDEAFMTKEVKDFIGPVAGYALVSFKFPTGTRFPCLPVAVEERGLLFPLTGESLCTAPEIELAQNMGAEIVIKYGVVIPWMAREDVFSRSALAAGKRTKKKMKAGGSMGQSPDDDATEFDDANFKGGGSSKSMNEEEGYRLFESFAAFIRERRQLFTRKTLPFEFIKLLGNSLYGKTGQGFKQKRTFGPKEMDSVVVGPSRVSEAAVASLVCGLIRAVIGEILWKLPADVTAVSATTDGFLVDCPIEQLDLSGTMCQRFQSLVDRVSPGSHMLENKHQVMQLFAGRTRLQFTTKVDGEHPSVTAKGGVKPGPEVKDENAYMLDLILNREPGQKQAYESFISMRDQLTLGYDLQTERRETTLNLEYDFKRRPIAESVRMVEIDGAGVSHLAFDTEPYLLAQDAVLDRLIFDNWRKTNCFKTIEDFRNWEAFRAFHLEGRKRRMAGDAGVDIASSGTRSATGRKNLMKDGYVGVAKRTFLAAYQKRLWGLEGADMSQRALADWLTECGYKTSLSAVKNGTGEQPEERVVPGALEVMVFLNMLKERFAGLEIERFLIAAE